MNWESQIAGFALRVDGPPFALARQAAWLLLCASSTSVTRPAARRVWTAVLLGMLLLPILSVTAPHWRLPVLPPPQDSPAQALPPVAVEAPLPLPAVDLPEMPPASPGRAFMTTSFKALPPLTTLIVWFYLAGFVTMVAYRAAGWMLLRRVIARSRRLSVPWLRESADVITPRRGGSAASGRALAHQLARVAAGYSQQRGPGPRIRAIFAVTICWSPRWPAWSSAYCGFIPWPLVDFAAGVGSCRASLRRRGARSRAA